MLSDLISYLVVGLALIVTVLRLFVEKPTQPVMPVSHAMPAELEPDDEAAPGEPSTEAAV